MIGTLLRRGSPQTPALMPQIITEEEDPVPDFFLDDEYNAGVGSPMSYSPQRQHENHHYQHSSDWSLKRSLFSFRALSPTPSLSEDDFSSSSDCDYFSGISTCPSPAPPDSDDALVLHNQAKSKNKSVRFMETVEILPFIPEEPKEEGDLKAPQVTQPRARKVPGGSAAESIGIMYGLGRAGGSSPPGGSLVHFHQQEFAKVHGQGAHQQGTNGISYSSDADDEEDGDRIRFMQRTKEYLHQLAPQPLFPPPVWRSQHQQQPSMKIQHPVRQQQQRQMQIQVIREAFSQQQQQERPQSRLEHRSEERFTLGVTSPTKNSFFNLAPSTTKSPPPQPYSPDGVKRQESNIRESAEYNQTHRQWQHIQEVNDNRMFRYEEHEQRQRRKSAKRPHDSRHDANPGLYSADGRYSTDLWTVEEAAEPEREQQRTGADKQAQLAHHKRQEAQIQMWNVHSGRMMQKERERERTRPGYPRGQRLRGDVHRRR